MSRPAAAILASVLALGCARAAPTPATPRQASTEGTRAPFTAKLDADHPLAGVIYDVAKGVFVSELELLDRARASRVVLLGEKHDHPDHHRLQARVLAHVASGRMPTVAFEMLDQDEQAAVDAVRSDPDGVARAVAWDKKGWPDFAMYRPLFAIVAESRLPLVAANLPRSMAKGIAKKGAAELGPERAAELLLDRPMDPAQRTSLEQELRGSHCGHLPEAMVPTMADAQRARDATMAERIAGPAGTKDGVVLIAGAGHARKDRGVPAFLRARGIAESLSIAFVEVRKEAQQPRDYAVGYSAEALPFDLVWFTPRLDDHDPCAAFGAKRAEGAEAGTPRVVAYRLQR